MNKRITIAIVLALVVAAVSPVQAGWDEGIAAFKSKNYTQAAKEFQALVQDQPEWDGGHFMLGRALSKLNRQDEALAHLRKAYDLSPNKVQYQMALGSAYLDSKRYSDSANLLSKIDASKLPASQRTKLEQALAKSYEKSGQSGQLLASLKKLAASQPKDANAQYSYGVACFNANETSNAVAALTKAVTLAPSDTRKKKALIKALTRRAGESRGAQKRSAYQQAVPLAKQLASAAPNYENSLTLGEVQLGVRDYAGAESSFRQAVSKNSSDWLSQYYLGQALTSLKKYNAAIPYLNQALKLSSTSKDQRSVWNQLGFANEKLKNYSASIEAYRKAGKSEAVARVEKNQKTASDNQAIEAENDEIQKMEAERKKLEKELAELPGGRPPR